MTKIPKATALAVGFAFLLAAAAAGAAEQTSVLVRTVSLQQTPVATTLTSYGVVNADSRRTVNISFPRAGEISRLLVSAGEVVKKGAPLLAFRTAPADAMDYQKAVAALDFARTQVQRTEKLVQKHLATNAELAASRKELADARALLQTERQLGKSRATEQVTAPFAGIVTTLSVKEGDRVPAGTTVLQLARQGALRADLGVEPEDVQQVQTGMPVRIVSVFNADQAAEGKVTAVHGLINPQTRLVDVLAEINGDSPRFLPGMQVRGRITLGTRTAWVVPRSAVLRDDQGAYIYQVDQGKAQRVNVQVEQQSDTQIAIRGDFDPARKVVTTGNYELQDGMAVRESTR